MKVAVYHTRQYGPSVVFTVPQDSLPESASVPHMSEGMKNRAQGQWAAKGHSLSWEQWAEHLSGQLPYFEQWSVEEVPDGLSAAQALSEVRRKESEDLVGAVG